MEYKGVVYEERWGLERWSTPYIYNHLNQMSPILWLLTPPVGQRERVEKFMASCRVQVKLLEKKVSPGEQTWCTPNISSLLRLEVSSYTGKRRLLQRVALVNW